VAVRLSAGGAAQAEVSIPLEVTLDSGSTARVEVHLKLTLNLKPR
jgi:hypothetical protein